MSNIVVPASYTIQSGEKMYILTIDKKGNPDLLYASESLKAKRLAKDTAIDLIKEFGWEEDLKKLSNHPDRNSPHTYEVLKLLEQVIKNKDKNETK